MIQTYTPCHNNRAPFLNATSKTHLIWNVYSTRIGHEKKKFHLRCVTTNAFFTSQFLNLKFQLPSLLLF